MAFHNNAKRNKKPRYTKECVTESNLKCGQRHTVIKEGKEGNVDQTGGLSRGETKCLSCTPISRKKGKERKKERKESEPTLYHIPGDVL